jgi:hypothetical protein
MNKGPLPSALELGNANGIKVETLKDFKGVVSVHAPHHCILKYSCKSKKN